MKRRAISLLAVMLLAFPVGPAAAANRVELKLPLTFKTTLVAGVTYTFTFNLLDSANAKVWTEQKAYKVPSNKTITHRLGSVKSFDNGIAGPVDFSLQLTAEVRYKSDIVYSGKLALAPYALWSADTEARSGSLTIRQVTGQTASLQEWLNDAGATLAAVAADGTISSTGGFVGDGSGLTNLSLGTTGNEPVQVKVNGLAALRIEPYDTTTDCSSPNFIGGFNPAGDVSAGNAVLPGVVGAVIAGGGGRIDGIDRFNRVEGKFGVVGGGAGNVAGDPVNAVTDVFPTIGGGRENSAVGGYSVVGGGRGNTIPLPGIYSTIGGGTANISAGSRATIAGGDGNQNCLGRSAIGGGDRNLTGTSATIGGGQMNRASGQYSFVGGGVSNTAGAYPRADLDPDGDGTKDCTLLSDVEGRAAMVAGGESNVASGNWAAVSGGRGNMAGGDYSFAAGSQARAWTHGSYVWADGTDGTFSFPPEDAANPGSPIPGVAANQFWSRATGGFFLVTAVDPATGVPTDGMKLEAGSGWTSMALPSDRSIKTDFAEVDTREVLAKVDALPIQTWSYKARGGAKGPTHMGPMAQDFRATFGLGADERHISPVDASGVALAAIQGLAALVRETQAAVAALERQLAEQRGESAALRLQVADLERRYAGLRALVAAAETERILAGQ